MRQGCEPRERTGALLHECRRHWRGQLRGPFSGRGHNSNRVLLKLLGRIGELRLNASRQLILPLGRDEGVLARHFKIAMAGNLRSLDGATADLLPPRDVGPPK